MTNFFDTYKDPDERHASEALEDKAWRDKFASTLEVVASHIRLRPHAIRGTLQLRAIERWRHRARDVPSPSEESQGCPVGANPSKDTGLIQREAEDAV